METHGEFTTRLVESRLGSGQAIKKLSVGDKVIRLREEGAHELELFSAMVGDLNPIHSDPAASKVVGFEGQIAHGMFAGSLFSEILGNELPGPGSVYVQQSFQFLAPIYVPNQIELCVEVVAVRPDQKFLPVRTTCTNASGAICLGGEAILIRRAVAGRECDEHS